MIVGLALRVLAEVRCFAALDAVIRLKINLIRIPILLYLKKCHIDVFFNISRLLLAESIWLAENVEESEWAYLQLNIGLQG